MCNYLCKSPFRSPSKKPNNDDNGGANLSSEDEGMINVDGEGGSNKEWQTNKEIGETKPYWEGNNKFKKSMA